MLGAYTYGPYGETIAHTGTATTPLGNATQSCGFSWGEQAVITGTAMVGAAPGLGLEVPQLLGVADAAPVGVNAFLAVPGAVITALEKDIKRELLGKRE